MHVFGVRNSLRRYVFVRGFALPVVSRKADLHEYLTVLYNGYMSLRLGMEAYSFGYAQEKEVRGSVFCAGF